jgi:hypothetical protein
MILPPTTSVKAATATVLFSNFNNIDCQCVTTEGVNAESFTPNQTSDFGGEAAFLIGALSSPVTFSMALYSSTSEGTPGSALWTSGTLIYPPNTVALFQTTYEGSPIPLIAGEKYFFAIDLNSEELGWLSVGSSDAEWFVQQDGGSWVDNGLGSFQFEIYGPGTLPLPPPSRPISPPAIPEPATWAMVLLGFAGLAYANYRRTGRARATPLIRKIHCLKSLTTQPQANRRLSGHPAAATLEAGVVCQAVQGKVRVLLTAPPSLLSH